MLHCGKANARLIRLEKLFGGKVSTFSILSGFSCPYAKDCEARAIEAPDGKRHIVDGKHTQFRCFSASQEALFTNVYKSRKENMDNVAKLLGEGKFAEQFIADMPKNTTILRWHVAGDIRSQAYFDAMIEIANRCPHTLFYAYTKSLPFWVKRLGEIPANFVLTASYGGYKDNLIDKHNLKYVKVVKTVYEAKKLKLPIDNDDSHALNKDGNFALLIHGIQPAGSDYGKAVKKLNGRGSYSRK